MRLTLTSFASDADATLSSLHVDGRFECFCLEDEHREVKVPGETRIPSGFYDIKLRAEGGMHERYKTRYSDHRGMLWLQNVPGFEWIYIHPGNTDDDTLGCILVGDKATSRFRLEESVVAYRRLYKTVVGALDSGEKVEISVERYDI